MSWKIQSDRSKKREIRKTYGATLEELILEGKDVIACDADLVGSSGADNIFEKYPEHCVNFGICEQNMIAGASAMSRLGYKPFVHSFSPFVSRRVMDQVYISAAFSQTDLHIFASEPGYWSQYNGATHTTFEDLAIMKTIPGVTVAAPSDAVTFRWLMRYYAEHGGVIYNRCTRRNIPLLYEDDSEFEIGRSNLLCKGSDVLIIAEGAAVNDALNAAENLEKIGISTSVIDLFFIKPMDHALIDAEINAHKLVVTVENHNIHGGVGEQIGAEIALTGAHCGFRMLGVQDRFSQVGTVDYLKALFHISQADIENVIKEYFRKL